MRIHTISLPSASALVVDGRGIVYYLNATETSGAAAAVIELYDGHSTGGNFLGRQAIAQSATANVDAGGPVVVFESGLFLNVVSGAFKGVVTVKLCDSEAEWQRLIADLTPGH